MNEPVKSRSYNSPAREAAARQTRREILAAARRLFVEGGYTGTTMAGIANEAGVALDTLYASVGPKPVIFRMLIESAISGVDEAVPALERDYVHAMRAEADASRKLAIYAHAVRSVQERLAPLYRVLQEAAPSEASLHAVWADISERRARNMHLLVADLLTEANLNPAITPDEAADILWATNSSEFFFLLVHQRGWSADRFEQWLAETWRQLLLDSTPD